MQVVAVAMFLYFVIGCGNTFCLVINDQNGTTLE